MKVLLLLLCITVFVHAQTHAGIPGGLSGSRIWCNCLGKVKPELLQPFAVLDVFATAFDGR